MYEPKIPDRRIVLVTGGSGGIGSAICNALAQQSAVVIDASIDSPGKEPEKAPVAGQIYHKPTDVTDPGSVRSLFEWMDLRFGGIDILINNAGVFLFKPVAEIIFEEWRRTMNVNLDGPFLCIRESLQRMIPQKQGQIINIGSVSGRTPLPNNAAYGASKAAIGMLTRIINEEYAGQNIKASLLTLGAVSTGIWDQSPGVDTREMITPGQVAAAVCFIIEQNLVSRLEELTLMPNFRFIDGLL